MSVTQCDQVDIIPPTPPPPAVTSSCSSYVILNSCSSPAPAPVISFEYDFNELSHYRLGQVSQGLRTMRCENVVLRLRNCLRLTDLSRERPVDVWARLDSQTNTCTAHN